MSKALSYIAMVCGAISSILFGILAALYPVGNTHLYLCIAVTAMEFIFIRFNLTALRSDQTDRLLVVNNGAILILLASIAYFVRGMIGGYPLWLDITIVSVLGTFALAIVVLYIITMRRRATGRLR